MRKPARHPFAIAPRPGLLLLFAALAAAQARDASAQTQIDWRFKGSLAALGESGRDLGLDHAGDHRVVYLDATPWVHFQFNDHWAAFVRGRLFAPTSKVLQSGQDSGNSGASNQTYVELREAWIEYGGLTSYPGEGLILGRQRIRNDDAEFFDQDLDALRWVFDTTLLYADLGAARQFGTVRSEGSQLSAYQKDRTYVFGSIGWDWAAQQRATLRLVHANDGNKLPVVGNTARTNERLTSGQQTWIGLEFDNHAYDWRQVQPVSYWASGTYLTGHRDRDAIALVEASRHADTALVTARDSEHVHAWAGELGLRAHFNGPVQAGLAYAYSGGGTNGDQYEQTGTQSNYSRFTGTRTEIYRFNEAFRPELGNLQAASAFVSLNSGAWDASVVYNKLRRPDRNAMVVSDALRVLPSVASHDLGQGVDLVLTRYFDFGRASDDDDVPSYTPNDIGDSSIRLKASWFKPGDAYGPSAKNEYRVMLEFTLWY